LIASLDVLKKVRLRSSIFPRLVAGTFLTGLKLITDRLFFFGLTASGTLT
jgi:hypothetical protein